MAEIRSVAISGASGFVGTALSNFLRTTQVEVRALVRSRPRLDSEIYWNYQTKEIELEKLEGIDAVIHLAGENIAGFWSASKKQKIRDSRVLGTKFLSESLAKLKSPPKVFIAASAIGFYGDRGEELLDEGSTSGSGFLAETCRAWEAAACLPKGCPIRVVNARIGIVLDRSGGVLAKMLLPFKLGLGGVLGSGKQYMSWISLRDIVDAFYFLLFKDSISGPVNMVAPLPVSNYYFTKSLGRVLRRPTLCWVPAAILRLGGGEMAEELLLSSTRVVPKILQVGGFKFQDENLSEVLKRALSGQASN